MVRMSGRDSPFTGVLTSEAANPRFFAVHTAGLGFSNAAGNVRLYLSTVALHNLPFGTRCTRPRMTNVRARMITARELLVTDISARNPLGGSGVQGRNVRALVRKHFATAVTRHLPCNLTGRTRTGMTHYWAGMAARPLSRTDIGARVRRR